MLDAVRFKWMEHAVRELAAWAPVCLQAWVVAILVRAAKRLAILDAGCRSAIFGVG